MRILSFAEFVAAGTAAAAAKNGTAASFLKNDRRIIMVGLTRIRSATATVGKRQSKWKCFNHGKT
jgi:hypothetical protein